MPIWFHCLGMKPSNAFRSNASICIHGDGCFLLMVESHSLPVIYTLPLNMENLPQLQVRPYAGVTLNSEEAARRV